MIYLELFYCLNVNLLVFIVIIGIGLLFLNVNLRNIKAEEYSILQIVLVSFFIGLFIFIICFIFFERIGFYNHFLLLAICFILGILGIYKSKFYLFIFLILQNSIYSLHWYNIKILVFIIPIIFTLLYFSIHAYSDFPILDLFQRVHFHAGAYSFSKYGILNPFYADSYIPFQQVLLGIFNKLGLDPLLMEWILPLTFIPIKFFAIYVFVEKFVDDKKIQLITVCLIVSILGVASPTNGGVSEIATFLFLSFLFSKNIENRSTDVLKKLFFLFMVFLCCIFILKQSVYFLAFLITLFLFVYYFSSIRLSQYFLIGISIFLVLVFHRSGLMYIPFAVFIYSLFLLFYKYQNVLENKIKYFIVFLIFGLFDITLIILMSGGKEQDIFGLWKFFDLILNPLVGKSLSNLALDKDLSIGSGSYITLFEIGRSLSLFLVIASIYMFIYFNFISKYEQIKLYKSYIYKANVLLFISLLFIALNLSGFPFIHRSYFFVVGLLSIATLLYLDIFIKIIQINYLRFIAILSLVYIILLNIIVNTISNEIIDIYLSKIYIVLVILTILIFLTILYTWNEKRIKMGIFFIFTLTILFETLLQKSYFKRYAFFGQVPEKGELFSHFNHKQLEVADILAKRIDSPKTIIISDPKTMALIGARTGNSPITSFSNLNTMPDETEKLLVDLLKKIKEKNSDNQICENSLYILNSHSSSTYNYLNTKLELKSGALALNALGYNNALVPKGIEKKEVEKKEVEKKEVEKKEVEKYSFIIVMNYDTLKWTENPKEFLYFPQNGNYEDIINLTDNQVNGYIVNDTYIKELKCIKTIKDKDESK